jgi:quercetin dioxygenase-like cupin family protein
MMFRRSTGALVLIVLPVIAAPPALDGGQAPGSSPAQPLVGATRLRMQPEDASTGGTRTFIIGDETKPGVYVYRNTFLPGQASRPHYHTGDRYVTVISGTWWTGEGDVFQPDKMIPIRAGGLMFHPNGLHHYDGARDEAVTVQIMGVGPIKTIQTEVDADGRPVGRR